MTGSQTLVLFLITAIIWMFGVMTGAQMGTSQTFDVQDVDRFITQCVNNGDVETYTKRDKYISIKCNDGAVFTLEGDEL